MCALCCSRRHNKACSCGSDLTCIPSLGPPSSAALLRRPPCPHRQTQTHPQTQTHTHTPSHSHGCRSRSRSAMMTSLLLLMCNEDQRENSSSECFFLGGLFCLRVSAQISDLNSEFVWDSSPAFASLYCRFTVPGRWLTMPTAHVTTCPSQEVEHSD